MKFSEIEKLLLARHALIKKNGIDFLRPVLKKLGDPQNKLGTVIHVTGTNGKGSTCAYLDSALRNCGFRVALYTSPHIFSMRERMKISGLNISEKEFEKIFERVYPLCKDLTFFEILTVMAFSWFAEKKPQFSVIEVGIGGLYDTTNIIDNTRIGLITSIGMDHTDLLGSTAEAIAVQKAGIAKKDSLLLYPPLPLGVKKAVEKTVCRAGGRSKEIKNFFTPVKIDLKKGTLELFSRKMGTFKTPLIGKAQGINLSLALAALEELSKEFPSIKNKLIKKGVAAARLHSRFELLRKRMAGREKLFIIDGAHNPQAASTLIETIKMAGIKNAALVFSLINTKDYRTVLKILSPFFKKAVFTSIDSAKAMEPAILADEYQKHAPQADIEVLQDTSLALKSAASYSDTVVVCGSFYLSARCLGILGRKK